MNITRIKALLLALFLGLTVGLGGCSSAPQETTQHEPIVKQRTKAEEKATQDVMKRAPSPASAPASEGDDMERLD